MKQRSILLFIVMILMLTFGNIASAQIDFDPCFGLNGDDCAAISAASLGQPDADSFNVNLSIEFVMDNLPVDPESGTIGSAEFYLDAVFGLSNLSAGMADPTALNVNAVMTASASEENLDLGGLPESTLEVRVVDGNAYIKDPASDAWAFVSLLDVLADPAFGEQMENLPIPTSPEDLESALGEDIPDLETLLPLVNELLNLPGLFTYTRGGDSFIWVMDLGALRALLEEGNQETLDAIIEIASEIDPSLAFIIPLVPTLIDEGTITVTQVIDPSGSYLDEIYFDVALVADVAALAGTPGGEPVSVDLNVAITLTDLDAVEPAVAPEGAEEIPAEELSGILGGALGGF